MEQPPLVLVIMLFVAVLVAALLVIRERARKRRRQNTDDEKWRAVLCYDRLLRKAPEDRSHGDTTAIGRACAIPVTGKAVRQWHARVHKGKPLTRKEGSGSVAIMDEDPAYADALMHYMINECYAHRKMTLRTITRHVNKNIVPISESALRKWMHRRKVKRLNPRMQFSQTDAQITGAYEYGKLHENDEWVDALHADEVWMYTFDLRGHYYVLPEILLDGLMDRDVINYATASRHAVAKVMYLIVVARPRFKHNFNGLVGCYPVGHYPPPDHTFKVCSMDAPQYLHMFEQLVAPDIVRKMDWRSSAGVRHLRWFDDNASSHVMRGMPLRMQRAFDRCVVANMRNVGSMRRGDQRPRTPNVNALDLGVNRALGLKVSRTHDRSIASLNATVARAFTEFDPKALERIFALVTCNCKVYVASGGVRKKNPHPGLRKAQEEGRLWEHVREWEPADADIA